MFVDHNVIFYWISYRPQTAHFCFTAPGGAVLPTFGTTGLETFPIVGNHANSLHRRGRSTAEQEVVLRAFWFPFSTGQSFRVRQRVSACALAAIAAVYLESSRIAVPCIEYYVYGRLTYKRRTLLRVVARHSQGFVCILSSVASNVRILRLYGAHNFVKTVDKKNFLIYSTAPPLRRPISPRDMSKTKSSQS